jgi:hypothetical protein
MGFNFIETFTVELPNVDDAITEFEVEEFKTGHGLVTEINAIHAGITANFNLYSPNELEQAVASWTQPYPKPVILNHDLMTEPLGRIIGARMEKEEDGTPYTKLQAAIIDPVAIQKVKDKRYLTGSVGGRADEAACSICDTNWAAPRESKMAPCRHARGKLYNGKLALLEMRGIVFKEYSFVNAPADSRSVISSVAENEWSNSVRFFVLDTKKESIVECKESENIDVLAEMKKKDATSLYMSLKGAFISAHADFSEFEEKDGVKAGITDTNSLDNNDLTPEETGMAKEAHEAHEEDEDILALTEGLSEDLSKISDEETAEEAEETSEEAATEEAETEEATAETVEETNEATEEEAEQPKAEEKADDVEAENSEEAPSNEAEEAESEVVEGEAEVQAEETELNESQDDKNESLVEELTAKVETLEQENTKLKKALHRVLAERVVDAKISAGAVEAEDRNASVEEHAQRTASSLADALRDFARLPKVVKSLDLSELQVEENSEVVGDEKDVITIGVQEGSVPIDPKKQAEDIFVNAFMGRSRL